MTELTEDNKLLNDVITSGNVVSLDVRPILGSGTDPFQTIMSTIQEVPNGSALEIINTFEPVPLIKILQSKGYLNKVEFRDGLVYTYFLKLDQQEEGVLSDSAFINKVTLEKFNEIKEGFQGTIREIDVRDLEMPLPMVTILNKLQELNRGEALLVNHKKIPQYLLPELNERNFETWITDIEEGNVKLFICI